MRKITSLLALVVLTSCIKGQIISGSFLYASYIRQYDLHLPTGWNSGQSLPLLFDLHYLGGDARDEDTLTQFNPIADQEHFIVCHPWGQGTNWNAGFYQPYIFGPDDAGFVNALIDTLHARYNIDLQRVYATGFGQGGFMVHRLACELGNRIAAVAAVGASIADSAAYFCTGTRAVPVMIIHGTADSVIAYHTDNVGYWRSIPHLLDFWKARNGCLGSPTVTQLPDLVNEGSTITSYRWNCNQNSEILHYEVINGGFAWPGASRELGNNPILNMDINASQEIWNFLGRFSLSGIVAAEPTEDASSGFSVFPNPVARRVTVAMPRASRATPLLFDLHGKAMHVPCASIGGGQMELDLSELPNGIYLLEAGGSRQRVVVMH